jgi:DNA-binding NtrC family response regulator
MALDGSLRVVCMSGYTEDATLRDRTGADVHSFIEKPFSLDALARTIRSTLGPMH